LVLGEVLASVDNTLAVASLLAKPGPIQRQDTDIDILFAVVIADMPSAARGRIQVQAETTTRSALMDMGLIASSAWRCATCCPMP
jgi:arylsulfatase A-like enzyme